MAEPSQVEIELQHSTLWWVPAIAGTLTTAAGVAIVAWPKGSVRFVTFIFGLALMIHGASEILTAAGARRHGADWGYYLANGVWAVAFGIPAVFLPEVTANALAIIFGIFMVVTGAIGVVAAAILRSRGGRGGRYLLRGLVAGGLGLAAVVWPDVTVTVVALIVGVYSIAIGALLLLAGFALGGFGRERIRHKEETA